jgi:hypothetical protein
MRPDAFTSRARGTVRARPPRSAPSASSNWEVTGRERRRIYEARAIFDAVYGPVDVEDLDH